MPTKKLKETKPDQSDKKSANFSNDNLSTAGFAVAIASVFTNIFTLGIVAIVGLVLSIIGRVQSTRAGKPSGLALAGIIISATVMFFTFLFFTLVVVFIIFAVNKYQQCETGSSAGYGQHCYIDEQGNDALPEQDDSFFRYERQPQI